MVEETEVTEERGVGPKERSFRKGWLMVSEAVMIKQSMSLKKKKALCLGGSGKETPREEKGDTSQGTTRSTLEKDSTHLFPSDHGMRISQRNPTVRGAFTVRIEGKGETFYHLCSL